MLSQNTHNSDFQNLYYKYFQYYNNFEKMNMDASIRNIWSKSFILDKGLSVVQRKQIKNYI